MFKIILGIIIGAVVVWFLSSLLGLPSWRRGRGSSINPEQIEEKQKNLEKVLELARAKGEISNDHVEHAPGISDSTATRYLEELASQGKLQRIGQRGKYVIYRPI